MFFNEKMFEKLAFSSNQYGLEKYGVDPFFLRRK
jgi:hypothetical protein